MASHVLSACIVADSSIFPMEESWAGNAVNHATTSRIMCIYALLKAPGHSGIGMVINHELVAVDQVEPLFFPWPCKKSPWWGEGSMEWLLGLSRESGVLAVLCGGYQQHDLTKKAHPQ